MRRTTDPLLSYGFMAALLVLVANDAWLKPAFGNSVTGKLSDFAGLFAFPLFWSAFFPRRRTAIHLGMAAAFVLWKLPAADGVIRLWNAAAPLDVARTADGTDLLALVSVAAAYAYGSRPRAGLSWTRLRWALAPGALLAFAATSFLTLQAYERTYHFAAEPAALLRGLDSLGITPDSSSVSGNAVWVRIPSDRCFADVDAVLRVEPAGAGTALTLERLWHRCPRGRAESQRLLYVFERCLVQRVDSVLSAGAAIRDVAVPPPANRGGRGTDDSCTRGGG